MSKKKSKSANNEAPVDKSKVENTSDDEEKRIKEYLESLKSKLNKVNTPSVEPQPQPNNVEPPKQLNLDTIFRQYVSNNKVKLYVLTPCYGGLCHVNYINKIMETKDVLASYGVPMVLQFIRNESLITRGRNNLMAKSMYDKDMTHILFIDSDITWEPADVLKLLIDNKELCGGIYPIKKYFWDRLKGENLKQILAKKDLPYNKMYSEEQIIYQNLLQYNFNYLQGSNVRIENNCMEVYTLATGFMMIQRSCIEKLIEAHPETKYVDDCGFLHGDENKYAYALFDCAIVNTHYFSEDWLFCHRWKNIGGKIYADVSINLWHTGQEDYQGRLISTLNLG
jgi:hypothetical protein